HLLDKRCGLALATGALPALRSDISTEHGVCPAASVAASPGVCAGAGATRDSRGSFPLVRRLGDAAVEPGPRPDGLSGDAIHRVSSGAVAQLSRSVHTNSAAADEVGDAR